MTMITALKRRFGFKRWIVLALIIFGIYLQLGPLPVPTPNVFLPGEPLPFNIPVLNIPLTNTFVAMLLTDIIVLMMGFYIWRKNSLVPSGFYNMLEVLFEFLWNTAVSTAGKVNASKFFPYIATIFIVVLVANWLEMIPGVDSIGVLEPAHGSFQGYEANELFPGGPRWIDATKPVEGFDEGGGHGECFSCTITPFVRVPATDLNFTLSLALISVFMTQVFGFAALKGGYMTKFFNLKTMFTVPVFGVIDFIVGLLELVSEVSKVISFTFRLFGNIFAGQLLLFILGSLVSFIVPTGLFMLDLFVGLIQAYVVAMLTLVFMQQATVAHGGDEQH